MTERKLDLYTLLMALAASIFVMLVLMSCDPIKRAMKRQERLDAAISEYLQKNPPKTDTIYLPGDTIYHTDTLVYENIYVDTIRFNDTVYIVKERLRKIVQKTVIRDTVLHRVSDCAQYQAIKNENVLMRDKLDKSKDRVRQLYWGIFGILGIMILLLTAMAYRR